MAHPFEGLLAQAFEAAGACAGLPDAAAYHGDFGHGGEAAHHVVELLAAFHAAGAGDEDGLFLVHGCSNVSLSVLLCGVGEKVAACVCGGVAGAAVGGGDGRRGGILNSVNCDGGWLRVCGKCVFLQNEIRGVAGVAGSPLHSEEVWDLLIF